MKKILIAAGFVLVASPAFACTSAQTESYNLAVRLMHTAVDISKTVGGPRADNAVNALMDLVESIDRAIPNSCGK